MRNVVLAALLAAVLAWPMALNAQQQQDPNEGWQLHDPNEYSQEDSHPVRAIASLLSPIGWALEWGVARPWHYVATNTFLAPVLNGGQDDDTWSEYYGTPGPPSEVPIPPQPTVRGPTAMSNVPMREQNLAPNPAAPPVTSSTTSTTQTATSGTSTTNRVPALGAPPYQPDTESQPVMH
jgi:hypothetical protein